LYLFLAPSKSSVKTVITALILSSSSITLYHPAWTVVPTRTMSLPPTQPQSILDPPCEYFLATLIHAPHVSSAPNLAPAAPCFLARSTSWWVGAPSIMSITITLPTLLLQPCLLVCFPNLSDEDLLHMRQTSDRSRWETYISKMR
jgi:hypothetical protein